MTSYSYSRLKTFEQCPLKYKYTYHDKAERDFANSIESFMGSRVHETLEMLYKDLKHQKLNTKEQVLNHYKRIWKENFTDNLKLVKEQYSEKEYYKMGLKYLEDYYESHKPFDSDYTLGLEQEVYIDLFNDEKYILKGYVDRLAVKENTLIIHDYKTSSTLPTENEINLDKQLTLYALALQGKYSDIKNIELVWHYLAFDKDIKITRTDNDYEHLKEEIKNKIDKIESVSSEEFTPKESILCDWCEFASLCPKKKHIVKTKQLGLEEFSKDRGVNLAKEYIELLEKKAELTVEIESLENQIFEYAKREKIDNIYSGLGTLKLYMDSGYKLPTKGTPKFMQMQKIIEQNNLNDYLTVDSYNLVKSVNNGLLQKDIFEKLHTFLEKKESRRIYVKKL